MSLGHGDLGESTCWLLSLATDNLKLLVVTGRPVLKVRKLYAIFTHAICDVSQEKLRLDPHKQICI